MPPSIHPIDLIRALKSNQLVPAIVFLTSRRSCDNALKAILDSIEHAGGYHDDSQIVWLLVVKEDVIKGGGAHVQIWQRDSPPSDLVIRLPWCEN